MNRGVNVFLLFAGGGLLYFLITGKTDALTFPVCGTILGVLWNLNEPSQSSSRIETEGYS